MEYQLGNSHPAYIKINVKGYLTKTEMLTAILEVMQHPDYHHKHSFCDCTDAMMGMSIFDLMEIVEIFKSYRPQGENFANKIAVLISGHMNMAIMEIFTPMTKSLPFHFKAFAIQDDLEKFLCS